MLAKIPCPTLVIWGTVSDVLSEAQARKMVEVLPHGELVSDPTAVEGAIARCLKAVRSGRSAVLHAKVTKL